MELISFASGSGGNAALLRTRKSAILVDAGVSARRITRSLSALGLAPEELTAVLITHAHADHVSGLRVLCRRCAAPIYASRGAAPELADLVAEGQVREFDAPGRFVLGDVTVTTLPTLHDAAGSVAFRVDGEGGSLGLMTDTGEVPDGAEALLGGVDVLVLEANHDLGMLESGPYPYALKRRVAGRFGHLSNVAAAEFALFSVRKGTRVVLLAHLSAKNNTPEAANYTVARKLQQEGCSVRLAVLPRDEMSEVYPCRKSGLFASES